MEQLTAQITQEERIRIFGAYGIKSPCIGQDARRDDFPPVTGIVFEIKPHCITAWNIDKDECFEFMPHEVKLILTPLSAITDEDAIEVAKIVLPLPFHRHKKGWTVARDYAITGWPYIKIHNNKNIYSVEIDCNLVMVTPFNMEDSIINEHPTSYVTIIDFLRSRSYDCGYGSIPSLITAGIAVEKTTEL